MVVVVVVAGGSSWSSWSSVGGSVVVVVVVVVVGGGGRGRGLRSVRGGHRRRRGRRRRREVVVVVVRGGLLGFVVGGAVGWSSRSSGPWCRVRSIGAARARSASTEDRGRRRDRDVGGASSGHAGQRAEDRRAGMVTPAALGPSSVVPVGRLVVVSAEWMAENVNGANTGATSVRTSSSTEGVGGGGGPMVSFVLTLTPSSPPDGQARPTTPAPKSTAAAPKAQSTRRRVRSPRPVRRHRRLAAPADPQAGRSRDRCPRRWSWRHRLDRASGDPDQSQHRPHPLCVHRQQR